MGIHLFLWKRCPFWSWPPEVMERSCHGTAWGGPLNMVDVKPKSKPSNELTSRDIEEPRLGAHGSLAWFSAAERLTSLQSRHRPGLGLIRQLGWGRTCLQAHLLGGSFLQGSWIDTSVPRRLLVSSPHQRPLGATSAPACPTEGSRTCSFQLIDLGRTGGT